MSIENEQQAREATQNLLDYANAVLHMTKTRLVNDCVERCRNVTGRGSVQTFYRRMQSPIGNRPTGKFFSYSEQEAIYQYFCDLQIDNRPAAEVEEKYADLLARLAEAIGGQPPDWPEGGAGDLVGRSDGVGLPGSGLPAAAKARGAKCAPFEVAGDKDYGSEIEGAASVQMLFLTGRTIIWQNKEHIRNALLHGTRVQIVFVDPEILTLLPEETWFGLCPLRGLLIRIEESIDTIRDEILSDLDPEAQKLLEVRYTKAIPTTHLVLIEKDGQTLIWHTPYLPGIESRESYRYIFVGSGKHVQQFKKSFKYAFEHSRNVFDE
ncbi:MAG: hypothetical protein FWF30_04465 [Coriobacteriia bacterium]|nr:hypothetical protein [Coriobacteriia bacterium]